MLSLVLMFSTQSLFAQYDGGVHFLTRLDYTCAFGENAPYWLVAKRQGVPSVETQNGNFRFGVGHGNLFGKGKQLSYSLAFDAVAAYNNTSVLFVQQAYAEIGWKWLNLSAGCKERLGEGKSDVSVFDNSAIEGNVLNGYFPKMYLSQLSELSTGGLIYSGNSRPIPQVRLEVPEYVPIAGTKGWFAMRGHIAYGRFCDDAFQERFTVDNPNARYGKNIMYHSKAAFVKIGKKEAFPLVFDGGLEMYSQFGGEFYTHKNGIITSMPSRFYDYIKAFIPMGGGDDTPLDEQTNISGNQIGGWHAALTLHTKPLDVRLYGEHMFEDFSQLFFLEYQSNNVGKRRIIYYPWRDIQVGVAVTNNTSFLPFVKSVLYEYISTYDQSGALYHDPSDNFYDQMDGVDNYYNHGIYPGWHHWGMGIGNPLVISPIYNDNGDLQFRSNRLKAHNVGINGTFGNRLPLAFRLQCTYSENWGTYNNAFEYKRYTTSLLGEVLYAPKESRWAATLSLGYDKSNHIGDNWGFMLSVSRVMSVLKGRKEVK